MSDLICPDCGHDIERHDNAEWSECETLIGDEPCQCTLNRLEATHAAQRAAAIAHVLKIMDIAIGWLDASKKAKRETDKLNLYLMGKNYVSESRVVVAAYRAVSILPTKERKP